METDENLPFITADAIGPKHLNINWRQDRSSARSRNWRGL